jgi:hypothetical protein
MADDTVFNPDPLGTGAQSQSAADVKQVFRFTPSGDYKTAISDNLSGFNHRQAPSLIPINKVHYGMTFFTRPRMNLQDENLRQIRKLNRFLSLRDDSFQRIVRCYLDPVSHKKGVFSSPLVDPYMPFIIPFTNLLLTLPGWPDESISYHTSPEGIRKEQFYYIDGTEELNQVRELTANFRNVSGDIITPTLSLWLTYMRGIAMGELIPHTDAMLDDEVDSDTRIYRITLDSDKRTILNIGATGFSAPVSNPIGSIFNFEADQGDGVFNTSLAQVSAAFVTAGIEYNDDITMWEFNLCSEQWFNTAMQDGTRDVIFQKLSPDEIDLFNYRGYPHIDLNKGTLEWYVRKDEYQQMLNQYGLFKK